jgi:hypothetical protein
MIRAILMLFEKLSRACFIQIALETILLQHRGKTSAHAPNYENMAGNLNINF